MSICVNDSTYLRAVALAAAALGLAACTSAQLPEMSEVKLVPDMRSFLPSNSNTFSSATQMRTLKPVGPDDLVDGQGLCAGMSAPVVASSEPGAVTNDAVPVVQPTAPRPVALEMTECEVARALGPPQRVEIGTNERGERTLVTTYMGSDRNGVYRFKAGRLASMERGPEPPAPPPSAKKPPKKPAKKAAPAKKKPDQPAT
jgi:hypothetical protein